MNADKPQEPDVEQDLGESSPEEGADVEAPSSDEVVGESEVSQDQDEQAALVDERDQLRDSLQRLQADFENFRKRMLKQQSDSIERANESLAQKLLPVLDTIDLAKAHEPNGSLEQVSVALLEVLNREGLERIESVETPFDPNHHEAVAHEPGEGEPKVSEEMRAGYRWKGRVIRPAMVKVVG